MLTQHKNCNAECICESCIEGCVMLPSPVSNVQLQCTISWSSKYRILTQCLWQHDLSLLFLIGFPNAGLHQSHEKHTQTNASLEERTHDDVVKFWITIVQLHKVKGHVSTTIEWSGAGKNYPPPADMLDDIGRWVWVSLVMHKNRVPYFRREEFIT